MTSPDVHTLTGAYALDALDDFERRQFERHLAQCPDCVEEVDELRATAARLAVAVTEVAPDAFRQRVMAEVATTRQEPPSTTASPRRGRPDRTGRGYGWVVRLGAVAAAAAVVVLSVVAVRSNQERDSVQAQLDQLQARIASVRQLASAPDARRDTGVGVHGGTAFVLASPSLDKAMLMTSDLPAPPSGHTYQAWLIGAGQPRSVGLVTPVQATEGPLMFEKLSGAKKVGLTIEPEGGSEQPTTTPVVLFDMPS
ncbi:anti-sigma factor [Pseudonocardia spinosispora]|uniref:anti-sigma factor n=1 Tax=Pseudonocardia spinosispora TaxID=103441 RepID=UPI00040C7506|nr:anti-sigma factor [Pseudonocardia spinosispora]